MISKLVKSSSAKNAENAPTLCHPRQHLEHLEHLAEVKEPERERGLCKNTACAEISLMQIWVTI